MRLVFAALSILEAYLEKKPRASSLFPDLIAFSKPRAYVRISVLSCELRSFLRSVRRMSFLEDRKLAKECPLRGIFTYLLSTTLWVKAKEKKIRTISPGFLPFQGEETHVLQFIGI